MRSKLFISAALTLAMSGISAAAFAQVNYTGYGQGSGYGYTTTTPVNSYTTTSTTPIASSGMTNTTVNTSPYQSVTTTTTTTANNNNLAGQVSQNVATQDAGYWQQNPRLWGKVRTKTLAMEPGRGQFSMNHVGMNDAVQLTLVNPTNMPLRFETSKRLGTEANILVPPNSSQVVQFAFNKPISDEVEYLISEDPGAAYQQISANLAAQNQQTAMTTTTVTPPQAAMTPAEPEPAPTVTQSRATVRGYW